MNSKIKSKEILLSENNVNQVTKLQQYLSEQNKILNHKVTRSSMREHNRITRLIKQGRQLGLLPFTSKYD